MSAKSRRPRYYRRAIFPSTRTLAVERLEDRSLLAGGLTGQYFDNANLTTLKLTRTDPTVDFDWAAGSPDSSIAADTFSARWTGRVQSQYSEPYTFHVQADDGVRLWVNRQLIVDNWMDQTAAESSGQIPLLAGQWYDVKLEYYDNTGPASARLSWSSPSQPKQVVPQSQLDSASGPDDRGSIQQEIWSGVSGDDVASLTGSPNYPAKPSAREYLTTFESLQQNWGDNYGERVRGYLVPAVTGSYVLAIAGDESTQLRLDATGADPAHPSLVAWSDAATGFREFTRFGTQQSAPITLAAGQKYYIEALHKEGTGNDHFSVGWQAPGTSQITVMPGDVLVPFGTDSVLPAQGSILTTLAPSHPRLLATPERFEWLKQEVAAAGQLQTWYNAIKTSADSFLSQALPQYVQDNRGTILSVSRSVVDHVYKLALVYRIGGDSKYSERAWQELDAAANFRDWHPAHFLDTAEMTHAFAIGYDWLYDYWTSDRRTAISNAIVTKGLNQSLSLYRNNSSWVADTSNNWNLVCNGGMVLGALALDDQPALAEEILAKAIPSAAAMMRHFTADAGAWYEGPGYWDYSTSYNARMMAALESALGSDFGLGRIPGVSETGNFAVNNTGPAKLSFNFADASAGVMRGPQLLWYARRYNRPLLAWYERTNAPSTPNPLDLLWYDGRGSDPASAALPPDVHYRGDPTAYATQDAVDLRSSWTDPAATFVGFKAGKVGDSHGHLDAGTFVMDALGQRWAYDLGGDDYALPGYFGSQRWDYYRLRAEGHNTLVINPGSAADQKANAITTILRDEATAEGAISIADLTAAYTGPSRVWRGMALSSRDGSVLVQDEILSTTPADVWWFMHVKLDPSQVQINADGSSALLTSGTNRLWVKILSAPGAQLALLDPTPLATSPNPSGQNANAGYKKLAIHLQNVTSRTLAVWLVPLGAGENPPATLPAVTALSSWSAAPDNQHWLGDVDGYTRNAPADDVPVDPAWQSQVIAATGLTAAGSDLVADNQAVPMTFNYSVPAGQQVVGAALTLGLRSTGGDTSSDRLYLDSMSNGYPYSALGWSALTTTPTARSLNLSNQLSLLQDGKLNVALQKNTAVDWAVLNVELGPTGQFAPTVVEADADASVRDGAYANQNFAAGELVAQKDAAGSNQESYLRFDLSGLPQTVTAAVLQLSPTAAGGTAENQLALVTDDTWSETGITWNNKPASDSALTSWTPIAGVPAQFDVSGLVQAALAGDKRLSLRIFATVAGAGLWSNYASRESGTPSLRPQLVLTTLNTNPDPVLRIDGDRDQPNQADSIRIVGDGGYVNVLLNNNSAVPDLRRDLATLQQIVVSGGGGDDILYIDFSNGNPAPTAGLSFDGGAGNDTLIVAGGGSATLTATQVAYNNSLVTYGNAEYAAFSTASVNVSATTLRLGADNALGAATDVTVADGGTLDFNGHTSTAHAVTLANGSITGGTLIGSSYTLQNGTVSATLAGTASLTKNTRGKVTLNNANAYTGTTIVYEGILNVRNAQALGVGNAAVSISCDGATNRYSALEFEGLDFSIDGKPLNTTGSGYGGLNATGAPFSANGAIRNINGNHTWIGNVTLTGGGGGSTYQSDAGTLTINGNITPNTTSRTLTLQGAGNGLITGSIQDGSTVAMPVTKKDAGAWVLSGNNTYTGNTTVSGGILAVDGSLAGAAVTVNANCTLAGAGSIAGATTIKSSGTLAPGRIGSVGTLTLAGLTLSAGSILDIDLAKPAPADSVAVTNLTLNGGQVRVAGGGFQGGLYTLIDYSGALGGSVSNLTLNAPPSGFTDQLIHNTQNTSVDLLVTDLNDAPTNIALSPATVAENQLAAATVGAFSTTDPDAGNTFTYTLVDTTNYPNNASFTIDTSGNLKTAATFDYETKNSYSIRVRTTDQGNLWFEKALAITVTNVPEVQGRRVFYNASTFDGNNAAANAADDAAIATDKTALLPGVKASFANYTGYSRGINGIMIDVDHLPGTPNAGDFAFRTGNGNPPTWTDATASPTISVRTGAGTGGSDRITLIWTDNTIQQTWLEVTVRATANTGLAANDVFYFGNAIGETGYSNLSDRALVNTSDVGKVRLAVPTVGVPVANVYDVNRDGRVNTSDVGITRNNTPFVLWLITAPQPLMAAAYTPPTILVEPGLPGLYDPAASMFYLRNSTSAGVADTAFAFGPPRAGWKPVAGDWDGDGRTTGGLYDPKTTVFHLRAIDPAAVDRIDLLTVVEHELGHLAGLKDLDAALDMLMSAGLPKSLFCNGL